MDDFISVWQQAIPYLPPRQNNIHVPIAFDFAQRLLASYPQANRRIVLPAVILHDIGWGLVPEEELSTAFGPHKQSDKWLRFHEVEGAAKAHHILEALHFDEVEIIEICDLIDGHDSRAEALSLHDQLLKDADKLWRFSVVGIAIISKWFQMDLQTYVARAQHQYIPSLFTQEATEMAQQELEESCSMLQLSHYN